MDYLPSCPAVKQPSKQGYLWEMWRVIAPRGPGQ